MGNVKRYYIQGGVPVNQLKKAAAIVLTFTMAAAMVPQSAEAAKKKVKLDKKTVTVTAGKTAKLKLKNNKKKVKWTVISGKKNVSLSKKGKASVTIKGKKDGKAKVQAKIGKKKYVCKVTVKNPKKVQNSNTKSTAAPGSNTGTVAGTKPGSSTPTPQPTATPTPTPTLDENAEDVVTIRKIIAEQRTLKAEVSANLQGAQYEWNGNNLIKIKWADKGLKGNLDLGTLSHLEVLECDSNQLTGLNVSHCTNLKQLFCPDNQLSSLDLSGNKELEYLHCYYNNLTSLDLTGNEKLIGLVCYSNQLTSLDVSKCTALEGLVCQGNALTTLNLTNNKKLDTLQCDDTVRVIGYTKTE